MMDLNSYTWALFFLRNATVDSSIFDTWLFDNKQLTHQIAGRAKVTAKSDLLLTDRIFEVGCAGTVPELESGAYRLWHFSAAPLVVITSFVNQNGIDADRNGKPAMWLGGAAAVLKAISTSSQPAFLTADFSIGPSLNTSKGRTIIVDNDGKRSSAHFTEDGAAYIPIELRSGENTIRIEIAEQRNISVLPNGDDRSLMLLMTNLKLCSGRVESNAGQRR